MGSRSNVARLIDIGQSNDPIEKQFLDDLKRSIEMSDEKSKGRIASKTFKPSSMRCKRNSYFQLIGAEPDTDESSFTMVGICNSGSDIHERIQKSVSLMCENGMKAYFMDVAGYVKDQELNDIEIRDQRGFETKLYNKRYNISFMCDGIIEYKGKDYILEIKTETSRKWYTRNCVDKKHYNQAIAYSLSMGLDDVIFLYISRDTLDMKAYRFVVDDAMRAELVDYIEDVTSYADRHIAPPKDDSLPRSVCEYCSYRSICKSV